MGDNGDQQKGTAHDHKGNDSLYRHGITLAIPHLHLPPYSVLLLRLDGLNIDHRFNYSSAVIWAASNQITARTSATTFSPEAVVSRAQAMTFLYRERT
ncbi:S-layer homology domain-containing protein [uncultured Oscillibacter sp.]|uniref:S-layer homology domain-containing protein n=1 Tax=uncultured Oscillibacter sp. TaxID=876091 RepID=UPI0034548264